MNLNELWAEVGLCGRIVRVGWQQPAPRGASYHPLLEAYAKGHLLQPSYEVFNPAGTAFQKRVWQALCDIPWGETITYGQLAARVGSHPRAVGGAVGANPCPVLIPCHRVMGAGGSLTGFSATGGLASKAFLLAHEGIVVQKPHLTPAKTHPLLALT